MSYKKISVSGTNTSEITHPDPSLYIVKDSSEIEVGKNDIAFEIPPCALPRKRKKRSGVFAMCAALILSCIFSCVLFAIIPFPDGLKTALISINELLGIEKRVVTTKEAEFPIQKIQQLHTPVEEEPAKKQTVTVSDLSYQNLKKLSNETKYSVDIENILKEPYPIDAVAVQTFSGDAVPVFSSCPPEVLIIHTHGTECYSDAETQNYRTSDTSLNVVSVGKVLCDTLLKRGISAIHCEQMFDEKSYIDSYSLSYAAANEYIQKYPTIKYIIDVHRDAISDSNGDYKSLLTQTGDKTAAQMMFVIGTDEAGAKHPNWQKNLRTALGIQKALCERYPSIMRPLNLRKASFNQQLSTGHFILEVGACGNTLEQAKVSAEIFAEVFAEHIS